MDEVSDVKRAGDWMRAAMQQARDLERMAPFIDEHLLHHVRTSSALPHAVCPCGAFWEPSGGEQHLRQADDGLRAA